MTTQFNTKSPTIRRILREAAELSSSPSPDYHAAPLDTNLFEWHFTLRGPPAPSPFANGIYHGRIVLPPTYPLRPPSFRFLTPSGRFEVNREICLSISGFHEESWQPAWGVRTAIVALRSFMVEGVAGQVGGLESSEGVRRQLAGQSGTWRCGGCGGRSNEEVLKEQEELARGMVEEEGRAKKEEEKVPPELRLGYREDIGRGSGGEDGAEGAGVVTAGSGNEDGDAVKKDVLEDTKGSALTSSSALSSDSAQGATQPPQNHTEPISPPAAPHPQPATLPPTQTLAEFPALVQPQTPRTTSTLSDSTSWVDYAIVGIVVMLIVMVMKKVLALEGL